MDADESISSAPNPPRLPIPPLPEGGTPSLQPTTTSDLTFLSNEGADTSAITAGQIALAQKRKSPKDQWSGFIDISNKGKWSVSSYKFGFGPECLRDDDPETFWHSDGPQPHYITVEFPGKIPIQKIAIYLNYIKDDSYTPSVLSIRAGTSINGLQDVRLVTLDKPEGWVLFDVSTEPLDDEGDGDEEAEVEAFKPIHAYVIQVHIAQNHMSGKDTHVRGMKVFGPKEQPQTVQGDPFPFESLEYRKFASIR